MVPYFHGFSELTCWAYVVGIGLGYVGFAHLSSCFDPFGMRCDIYVLYYFFHAVWVTVDMYHWSGDP